MAVKRIVSNVATKNVANVQAFYSDVFGLNTLMDFGWVATLGNDQQTSVQVSIASEGGSGTPVPDLSIEVDDLDQTYARVKELELDIEYPLTQEPWGVRRFYIRDPAGKLLNVLAHI